MRLQGIHYCLRCYRTLKPDWWWTPCGAGTCERLKAASKPGER